MKPNDKDGAIPVNDEQLAGEMAGKSPAAVFARRKLEFKRHLLLEPGGFIDMQLFRVDRQFHIDLMLLEDWLAKNEGYDPDGERSLADFIAERYGKAARDFVEANL